jgi:alpha-amylase/alpha-mannosidase (GH57 family)
MAVRVALLWHMHQPDYRDPRDGRFVLPWVRLHALKDYLGMVTLLEEFPEVRVTFNLVPALLDQLESYALGSARDEVQELSTKDALTLSAAERGDALRSFFQIHPNLIARFPRFEELSQKRGKPGDEAGIEAAAGRFSVDELRDLQLLAKLAWFDRDWLEDDKDLCALVERGRDYSEADKALLAEREQALLRSVLPAYRRAAQRGNVELSTSPYYHPILPLLCDTEAHHEAHPGAPLPRRFQHPEDARDQILKAMARHEALFGEPPRGLWPPEGSLSEAAVAEITRCGLVWTASDEAVLQRSLSQAIHRDSRGTAYPMDTLYRPWRRRTEAGELAILFRDRALSDLIGFSYAGLEPRQAASDMLDRLRRVGERWHGQGLAGEPVVGVMLDGENAWEHFRDGGRDFLRALYGGLRDEPELESVTLSEAVSGERAELPRVFAGSWIHADFSVWIGHHDDRRAWELLGETRDALAAVEATLAPEARHRAWEAFRAACGSDWCWWYGEENKSENAIEFDALFRGHLEAVYREMGERPPDALGAPLITVRRLEPRHSRPTGMVLPVLDGRLTTPDEWVAAGVYQVHQPRVAMRPGQPGLTRLCFGVGGEQLHVLVEGEDFARHLLATADVVITFPGPTTLRYRIQSTGGALHVMRAERTGMGWIASATQARAAAASVLEVSIPVSELRPGPGQRVEFRVLLMQGGVELDRQPEHGPVELGLEEIGRE